MEKTTIDLPFEKSPSLAPSEKSTNEDTCEEVHVVVKGKLDEWRGDLLEHTYTSFNKKEKVFNIGLKLQMDQDSACIASIDPRAVKTGATNMLHNSFKNFKNDNMRRYKPGSIKSPLIGNVDHTYGAEIIVPTPVRAKNAISQAIPPTRSKRRTIQTTLRYLKKRVARPIWEPAESNGYKKGTGGGAYVNNKIWTLMNFRILSNVVGSKNNQISLFMGAYRVLKDVFKGKLEGMDLDNLDPASLAVVEVVMEKKFEVRLGQAGMTTAAIESLLANEVFKKRPEECKKMVFGYVIKQLKRRLKDSLTCRYRKSGFEEVFYRHYFEAAAKQEGLPIEDFYYPIVSDKKKVGTVKTINKVYIANIKKSDLFISDFEEYIVRHFLSDYTKEIDVKLFELIAKFESLFKHLSLEDLRLKLRAQLSLSKTKLPWTLFETRNAISRVKSIVN